MKKYIEYAAIFLLISVAVAVILVAYGSLKGRKKCSDFYYWQDAQNYMTEHGATYLDRDHDGFACDSLIK